MLSKQVANMAAALKSQGEMLKCGLSVRLANGTTFMVYGAPTDIKALQRQLSEPWRADL